MSRGKQKNQQQNQYDSYGSVRKAGNSTVTHYKVPKLMFLFLLGLLVFGCVMFLAYLWGMLDFKNDTADVIMYTFYPTVVISAVVFSFFLSKVEDESGSQ